MMEQKLSKEMRILTKDEVIKMYKELGLDAVTDLETYIFILEREGDIII